MLLEGKKEAVLLGNDAAAGQRAMAVIPKGAVFAAENIDPAGYTFLSCATAPAFRYAGFRLVSRAEIERDFPAGGADAARLAFEAPENAFGEKAAACRAEIKEGERTHGL